MRRIFLLFICLVFALPALASQRAIKAGDTDQSVVIRIVDSTDGTPETSVAHDTSGIDLWYRREGATKTSLTEAALAALDSAHSDGGIEPIGDGYYRLDLPDAAVAASSDGVQVGGTVTGMIVIGCYIELTAYDPQDSVRMGLTAMPNAAADAAGGLVISDAGGLDIDTMDSNVSDILTDTGTTIPGTITTMQGNVTDILADTNELQTNQGNWATAVGFSTHSAADVKTAIEAVGSHLALILADTGELQTNQGNWLTATGFMPSTEDGSSFTAIPWNAAWDAEVQSEATDALNAYDPPTAAELTTAVGDVSVDEIQATALADLFNTDSGTTYGAAIAGSVVKEIADNAGGSALTESGIADAVWDEILAGHADVGSTGAALSAAGGSGDPWSTAVPGAYGAGTAGYIIGTYLDEAISGLPTAAEIQAELEENGASILDTISDKLPTNYIMGSSVQTDKDDEVDAIKLKTDRMRP